MYELYHTIHRDDNYNERIKSMTLLQFASSKYVEDNPMVRLLTNTRAPYKLAEADLQVAKKIIELKCLLGLYRDLDASLARFHRYFRWNDGAMGGKERKETAQTCKSELTQKGDTWLTAQKEKIEEGGDVWKQFAKSNELDLELYEYVESLYKYQGEKIFDIVE